MVETFVILEARLRVRYNGCSSPQSSRCNLTGASPLPEYKYTYPKFSQRIAMCCVLFFIWHNFDAAAHDSVCTAAHKIAYCR